MEKSKVKTSELYAASESEKQSLIDWYKDHSPVELHNDGINTLVKICPPDEYGEDEDCEGLQNVIRVMYYRITKLEARNKELEEALLKAFIALKHTEYGLNKNSAQAVKLAEQALNNK